ncbi:MAG: glycosyltransferase [Phycisphaerales bacterium]
MPPAPDPIREAIAQAEAGRVEQGVASLRRLVQRRPHDAEAVHFLGILLTRTPQSAQAEFYLRRSVELAPERGQFRVNHAAHLGDLGRHDEAVIQARGAIELTPADSLAWTALSRSLLERGDSDEAADAAATAVRLDPALVAPRANLGLALVQGGRSAEAVAALGDALEAIGEHPALLSMRAVALNYVSAERAGVRDAHRRAGAAIARAAGAPSASPLSNTRDAEGRLRIGYLSPDFRAHSVAWFIEPVLERHDRSAVEVFCYHTLRDADATTARLRALADQWCDAGAMDDAGLGRRIRDDAIDVLVDLAGHTGGNRLGVAVRRPAPVIATYLGYPNTTGLPGVGWRIVDALTDPPGESDTLATERLARLDRCFLCYRPPADAPEPTRAPGGVAPVFGSFNTLAKVGSETLDLWADVLRATPGSRLLLKAKALGETRARERLTREFERRGVAGDRLDLVAFTPSAHDHLSLYGRVDVALDTFPYHGTTTTCEALWMGVPIVTLAGRTHAGRVGISLLHAVGLPEFVAATPDEYARLATAMALDRARLEMLRATLRERVRASPLCDAAAHARALERVYRAMWREWCGA